MKKHWKLWVAVVAFSILSIPNVSAFASGNGGSGGWNSTFRVWSPDDDTGYLPKYTTSSIRNSTAFVSDGTKYFMGWAAVRGQHGAVDASHGYHYQFYTGTRIDMYNYVVEDYRSGIPTTVYMQSWSNGNANGWWKPDI